MKNFFIAVDIEQDGLYYPHMVKVSNTDNLLARLDIDGIISANICKTKKECESIVRAWRYNHKLNDELMFNIW